MLLKRLQLWDLRLLLLRSIREEKVVINQVNQFNQTPHCNDTPEMVQKKDRKRKMEASEDKAIKEKIRKAEMNVRRKSWQFLIQVGFPFSDLFCVFFFSFSCLRFV